MRFLFFNVLFLVFFALPLHAADHAVVLMYHHVSDETPPSTSVSPETFRQHLDFLETGDFQVLKLSQVLDTLTQGGTVPEKTVSISFDDAYVSVLNEALPELTKRNWPFTVFVNTEAIDKGYRNYLDWEALQKLMDAGAEIGNHGHSHAHLVRRLEGESEEQWQLRITEDIGRARQRLKTELGVDTRLFAYPFGEYTPELQELVESAGYYGVAQQSGVVGQGVDRLAVPRFPMATNYSDMQRFAISVNASPLPVKDVSAGSMIQEEGETCQQTLAVTLLPGNYRLSGLACYSSSGEKLDIELKDESGEKKLFVQLPNWKAGRRKVNCTAPSTVTNGVYYWYSRLWLVTKSDGSWYSE